MIDPDSKMMKSNHNIKQRYNAQAISNRQIIVAADVISEENDQNQLISMVEQIKENLNIRDTRAVIADVSEDEVDSDEEVNDKIQLTADAAITEEKKSKDNPCHRDCFTYHEDEDHYVCPEGKPLEFQRDEIRGDKKLSHYASSVSQRIPVR